MFELKEQEALLANVNPRAELHGTDTNLAVDLSIAMSVPNSFLEVFAPGLKQAFFQKDPDEEQQDMISDNDPDHLPALRFPQLAPLKFDYAGAGYRVVVHSLLGKSDVVLVQCEVDKFRFELKNGGTVLVSFRVVAHPTADEVGRLCELIQQNVSLTLEPPSAEDLLKQELNEAAA